MEGIKCFSFVSYTHGEAEQSIIVQFCHEFIA